MLDRRCTYLHPDGVRCGAPAVAGSFLCFWHDPACKAQADAARREGGRSARRLLRVLPPDAADLPLATAGEVAAGLAVTFNQTRRGEIDPKVANALSCLAAVMLRALEAGQVQEEVAELRELVEQRTGRRARA
jgi:hypothetical protein